MTTETGAVEGAAQKTQITTRWGGTIKGLSLTQPWASLVALGRKKIETRSWNTRYRGLIAIHAAKGFPPEARDIAMGTPFIDAFIQTGVYDSTDELPRGAIVATARLVGCVPTPQPGAFSLYVPEWDTDEYAFGDYSPGRFMWFLEGVQRLHDPIPCKGALSLWALPPDVEAKVREATRSSP